MVDMGNERWLGVTRGYFDACRELCVAEISYKHWDGNRGVVG